MKELGSPLKMPLSKLQEAEKELFGDDSASPPRKEKKHFHLTDFEVQAILSRGAFGWVFLVKHPEKGFFVIKRVEKSQLQKEKHL
jgi:serine/threonine protein kinase